MPKKFARLCQKLCQPLQLPELRESSNVVQADDGWNPRCGSRAGRAVQWRAAPWLPWTPVGMCAVPSSAPRCLDDIVGLGTVSRSALRALSACAIPVAISVQTKSPASRRAMCWRGRPLATDRRCSSMPWVSPLGDIRFHFGHNVRPCPRPLLGVQRCGWFVINALKRCAGSPGGPDIIEPRNFEDWITRVS